MPGASRGRPPIPLVTIDLIFPHFLGLTLRTIGYRVRITTTKENYGCRYSILSRLRA